MPQFKIVDPQGGERLVRARRARRLGGEVLFEERSGSDWKVVASVPAADVYSVLRRVTELDGTERWITQPVEPAYIAAAPRGVV